MKKSEGVIVALSISKRKGTRKKNIDTAEFREDFGMVGDAHAGTQNRQVSLLAEESIGKMKAKGLDVGAGDFAENITTKGMDLLSLSLGAKIRAGKDVVLELSQIGKVCHSRCNIYKQAGDCVMPKEGIFARVLCGGKIKTGDEMEVISNGTT